MFSWRKPNFQPKKIVYGMSISNVEKLIKQHESRGWEIASEIKKHGYGYGCLMKLPVKKGVNKK
jgi:hypothetical protein